METLNMRLKGSTAIVTGAAGGIGEAISVRFAEEGANVVAVDIEKEGIEETVSTIAEIEGAPDAVAIPTDITSEEENAEMVAMVEEKFGEVDVLVNNAGVRVYGPVTDMGLEDWMKIVQVNLIGMGLVSKYVIPLMDETGGGSIVNISSDAGTFARHGMPLYDATKSGVLGLTRAMSCDHADQGIRVNAIQPGAVYTDYHEERREKSKEELTTPHADGPGLLNRWAEPSEIANGALFLASDEASFITSQSLMINGGIGALDIS